MGSRRSLLEVGAAALLFGPARLRAWGDARFWEKGDPASWTAEQIEQLTTNSPWAKKVIADLKNGMGPMPSGREEGGRSGRRGGGGVNGPAVPRFPAVVRWASAKPIREAMKLKLPESMAEHLVISVSGVPIPTPEEREEPGSPQGEARGEDAFASIKRRTALEAHRGEPIEPGVASQEADDTSTIYFGFLPSLVNVADAKTVSFSMNTGVLIVKAKFSLAEMKYRGELAV